MQQTLWTVLLTEDEQWLGAVSHVGEACGDHVGSHAGRPVPLELTAWHRRHGDATSATERTCAGPHAGRAAPLGLAAWCRRHGKLLERMCPRACAVRASPRRSQCKDKGADVPQPQDEASPPS